jgi:LysM repeat protein
MVGGAAASAAGAAGAARAGDTADAGDAAGAGGAAGADLSTGAPTVGPASVDIAAADEVSHPSDQEPFEPEPATGSLPEDVSVAPLAAAGLSAAAAPTFATTGWEDEGHENEQLGAFDSASADAVESAYGASHSSYGEPDAGYLEPPLSPTVPVAAASPTAHDREASAAAVPAFLAGRSSRPPTTPATSPLPARPPQTVSRDEIVPSWEIDGRYGAEGPENPGGGRLDGILTAIAVIAILAIGVAAVVFLPGLLNRGSTSKTPPPSIVVPSGLPTALPSALPTGVVPTSSPSTTIVPSVAPPTSEVTPAPEASLRPYKIKPGDTLAHIANKFNVTVQAILDANPSIPDPNHIEVGQVIVIPPSPTPTPSSAP